MRKFAVPVTVVLGAQRVMDETGINQRVDRRGRPIWRMPEPVNKHEVVKIVNKVIEVDGKPKVVKRRQQVEVPVFRGMDSAHFRYARAQFRRMQRKMDEYLATLRTEDGIEGQEA